MKKPAAVLLGIVLVLAACGDDKEQRAMEQKATQGRAKMHQQVVESALAALSGLATSASAKEVADACDKVQANELTDELRQRCSVAHLAVAKSEFRAGFAHEGNAALERAAAEGVPKREIDGLASLKKTAEGRTAKREKQLKAAAGAADRLAAAKRIRQGYLDDDLDIKVSVSGRFNERITFEYAPFNDVWANKLHQTDLLAKLGKAGFERLDLVGYDYHVYWDLTKSSEAK